MDSEIVDKQLAALRADDERIADALATLETHLTAWLAAMRDGQEAIIAGLSAPRAVVEPDAATPPELAPQARDESEAAVQEAPSQEPALDDTSSEGALPEETSSDEPPAAEAEPPAESPAVDSKPACDEEPEPTQQPAPGGGMFQTTVPIRGVPKPERPKPADGAEAGGSASSEEDEALLAELDEETARLIRVKRRLCNNERSVRELLDELQGERESGEPRSQQQQRNRWWR